MIEQIITKIKHLERTSETDEAPARWAIAEIQRHFDSLSETEKDSAVLRGWRGARIEYKHRRSDLEVSQERAQVAVETLRATAVHLPIELREKVEEVLAYLG